MKRKRTVSLFLGLAVVMSAGWLAGQSPGHGTLVFDVKNYSTDVKFKENIQKQLEHGFIEWGLVEKNVVITLVNRKYIKPELQYSTRYGSSSTLQLEPGEYTVTCIGYIPESNSRDIEKVLSKSAFFNLAVLKFNVLADKTTVLQVFPTIEKHIHRSFATTVKMYMPDLRVSIIEDGVPKADALINARTESSVSWDNYHGPLKY